MTNAATFVT